MRGKRGDAGTVSRLSRPDRDDDALRTADGVLLQIDVEGALGKESLVGWRRLLDLDVGVDIRRFKLLDDAGGAVGCVAIDLCDGVRFGLCDRFVEQWPRGLAIANEITRSVATRLAMR